MTNSPVFEPFGLQHWAAVGITIGVAIALPLTIRHLAGPDRQDAVRQIIAICLVGYVALSVVVRTTVYGLPLKEHLPLHLCGVSILLGAVMLWRRSYRLYEVVYFWGIGGTLAALLTPDLPIGFPHPLFILFFVGHGLALTTVVFAIVVLEFQPRARSLRTALLALAGYAVVIFAINLALDSNYLYLMHKPERPSPLDYLGSWPWYLPGLAAIVVVVSALCYLPFAVRNFVARRRSTAVG